MRACIRVTPSGDTPVKIELETTLDEIRSMIQHIDSSHWPLSDFKEVLRKALLNVVVATDEVRVYDG